VLKKFTDNKYFKAFIKGVKPVVVALILSVGVILLAKSLGYVSLHELSVDIINVIIFALVCAIFWGAKLIFKKKITTIPLILISAGLGIAVCTIFEYLPV
jgi:chromate transport protein ChrA